MNAVRTYILTLAIPLCLIANLAQAETAKVPRPPGKTTEQPLPQITNWDAFLKDANLTHFKGQKSARKLKVAIFDLNFDGYKNDIGKTLPEGTQYHAPTTPAPQSAADDQEAPANRGRIVANLLAETLKRSGAEVDYELHLFDVDGYEHFEEAANQVVQDHFDLVLCPSVRRSGGNGDGKGFIDAFVDKVTQAGIIWVNGAGEFGKSTRVAPVDGQDWVIFKDSSGVSANGAVLQCKAEASEKCRVHLVLTWNKISSDEGADRDLDLFLLDRQQMTIVDSSTGHPVSTVNPEDPRSTLLPRKAIETSIAGGKYLIQVKIKSKNFDAKTDMLRITATGPGISLDNSSVGETLLPPADSAAVLVVGASDDEQSSEGIKEKAPQLKMNSDVKFAGDAEVIGTAYSAAKGAALAILQMSGQKTNSRYSVLSLWQETAKQAGSPPPATTPAATETSTEKKKTDKSRPVAAVQTKQPSVAAKKTMPAPVAVPNAKPSRATSRSYSKPEPSMRRPIGHYQPRGRGPQPPPCFEPAPPPVPYQALDELLGSGDVLATYWGDHYVIFVDRRLMAALNMPPLHSGDRLFLSPMGFQIVSYGQPVPGAFYEVIWSDVLPAC